MAPVFRQLIRLIGMAGVRGVTGVTGALYLQRNMSSQKPPKNKGLTFSPGSACEPPAQPYPFNRTDIGNGPKNYIHSRILVVEAKLSSPGLDDAERKKLHEELVQWRTPQPHFPKSEIEDSEYKWYFCEGYDAYSINKGTPAAEEFEKLIYEADRKRFIKENYHHHFVVGRGFDDINW